MSGPFHGQLTGELVDPSLGHAVGEVAPPQRAEPGDRADVDDAPAASLPDHRPARLARGHGVTRDADRHDVLPLGQAEIFGPGVASRSGVVDQDVYRSERVSDRRERRLNRLHVTGVAADEDRLAALGAEFAGRSFPALRVYVEPGQVGVGP